jgi:long-chain acyl-CoA synthetase
LFGEKPAFYLKVGRKWQPISSKDYTATIDILSLGLLTLGIKKGENIATIFTYNCPQWNFIDMALAKIGAVHVPVYPSISDSDYLYILNQAKVRYVIASDQVLYNKLTRLQKEIPTLEKVITIENLPNVDSYDELIQLGFGASTEIQNLLDERVLSNKPDDIVTIIYTSGSTGLPKGAMLTHTNLVTNMYAAAAIQPLGKGHRVMSFLPLCHVYERTANYQFQFKGATIYYCENLKSLTTNMREVKPHGITVVPRLLEKVIKFVMVNTRKGSFLVRMVVRWSIRFGFKFKPYRKHSTFWYRIRYKLADLFIFRSVRASFGGRLRYIGCGGAPINEKVERFFWAAKMPVYQGYGLSECSPLVALNFPGRGNYWIGTVGPVIEDVEVKIAHDGEILCKGPNVMKGYFLMDELTGKTIVNGWLHTGDIGKLVRNKYLKITGRKKQMFKTSYGKYIVPQAIESKFVGSDIIDYLVVIGEGKHCAAAIISPNFPNLRKNYDKQNKLSNAKLIEMPTVKKAIRKEIDTVNKTLGKTERIQKHLIVPDAWSAETGELSPTLKIKRNLIQKKYKRQIHLLYRMDSI